MQKNVLFFMFLGLVFQLNSQSLSIFDIDTTAFPTMKAKFYTFDKDGNQIRPNVGDLAITENGQSRVITKVSCPAPKPPIALSSVLVFDISGSMSDGPPRIASAKQAANAWIDGLPTGKSECGLVTFSDNSFILHDFTKDKNKLKNEINKLSPTNGTNYNQALLDPPTGGLEVAKTGRYKRVIIFLTDGLPNFEPKTQEIIKVAKDNSITIYAVTLDMPTPQSIKDMTTQTGGLYFENITSKQQAEDTYSKLLQLAQGCEACEIEWESGISCTSLQTKVELTHTPQKKKAKITYNSPNKSIARLEFTPTSLKLLNPIPGIQKDTIITLKAYNSDFTVSNITSNNGAFFIKPTSFTLKSGDSIKLTLSYIAPDSGYVYCKFDIENNLCSKNYFVSAGWKGIKPTIRTLKLIKPNGGEVYVAGSDTLITWEGVPPTEKVIIEYRTDDTKPWVKLTDTATGLSYKFRVPNIESKRYLARITARGVYNNDYPDVEICGKIWMGSNLDVDTYRNGDPIPEVTDRTQWYALRTGAWCYYDNDPANGEIYGKLYNWYAVNDPRGLAPVGWHVPSVEEWKELANCLGGGSVAGGKLKSTGTIKEGDGLWKNPNTGATNSSGFTALPGGYRIYDGNYDLKSEFGYLWSSTSNDYSNAFYLNICFFNSYFFPYNQYKGYGCSVRCVRD